MQITIIPVLIFLALLLAISFVTQKKIKTHNQKEYFLAGRNLGGVVLAMTLVATYGSVSSFVSGPGIAWNLGLGWVVFAAPQIITGFFILGLVGKKMAVLSRKTGALTVIDLLHERYQSRVLSLLLAFFMILFFMVMIIGQFIGGAQIFAALTGLDYSLGLLLFATVTVIYTSGGFRAVALTDAICAIFMLTGMIFLGYTIIQDGGGLESVMTNIKLAKTDSQGNPSMLTFDASGALPISLLFSAWVLVGFGTAGLPQSMVRCMAYRHTSDLHKAMLYATVICGALMIGMTALGVLARSVITECPKNGTDAIIPTLIVSKMDPLLASITIIGPLAATMSTVSSLLISSTSTLMRDFYFNLRPNVKRTETAQNLKLAYGLTLLLGLIAIVLALYPLDLVAWINLFAFGGLEAAFIWPLVLGLFWSKMHAKAAIASVIVGLGVYALLYTFKINFFDFHNIVFGLLAGLIAAIVTVFITQDNNNLKMKETFFPDLL